VGAVERPAPAVLEADQLVAVALDPAPHDRPDGGVEARAVAASGEYADPHGRDDTRGLRRRSASGPKRVARKAPFPESAARRT